MVSGNWRVNASWAVCGLWSSSPLPLPSRALFLVCFFFPFCARAGLFAGAAESSARRCAESPIGDRRAEDIWLLTGCFLTPWPSCPFFWEALCLTHSTWNHCFFVSRKVILSHGKHSFAFPEKYSMSRPQIKIVSVL